MRAARHRRGTRGRRTPSGSAPTSWRSRWGGGADRAGRLRDARRGAEPGLIDQGHGPGLDTPVAARSTTDSGSAGASPLGRVDVVRRDLAVLERAQAASAGSLLVGVLHRLDDVLAHDRAGVEVAQLEVGVLRAELVAQLVAGGVGEPAAPCAPSRRPASPGSGSRSGPKTRTATNAMTANSGRPTPNTRQNLLVGVSPSCIPARPRPRADSVAAMPGEHPGGRSRGVGLDDRLPDVAALPQ